MTGLYRFFCLSLILLTLLMVMGQAAQAQGFDLPLPPPGAFEPSGGFPEDNVLDDMHESYSDVLETYAGQIQTYTVYLFFALVTIDFAYSLANMALKGTDMKGVVAWLWRRVIYIGFFLWLIQNGGFATEIIGGFESVAANSAGNGARLWPSDIFDMGINLGKEMINEANGITENIFHALGAFAIVIVFALITCIVVVAEVEAQVAIILGFIMLAFAGSQWTKEFGTNYLKMVLGLGVKLMVLRFIVQIGYDVFADLITEFDQSRGSQILILVGIGLVLLAIVNNLPSLIQGIVNGATMGQTGSMLGAAAQVGGVGAAAIGAGMIAGQAGGSAIRGAVKAGDNVKSASGMVGGADANGGGWKGGLKAAAKTAGLTGSSYAEAAVQGVARGTGGKSLGDAAGEIMPDINERKR